MSYILKITLGKGFTLIFLKMFFAVRGSNHILEPTLTSRGQMMFWSLLSSLMGTFLLMRRVIVESILCLN